MKQKVLKILKQHKKLLKEKYGITKLGLFGSVARGEENPNDVDIIFDFNNPKFDLLDMIQIKHIFEDKLNKKVDFIPLKGLKQSIRNYIDKEVIYV
jgi:predicted nucleotidyltransferase